MSESIDPRMASVDGLIEWLGEKRRRDPASPLSELLDGQSLSGQRLVDLACIDLMQCRRLGRTVSVEDYLEDFPTLRSESNLLDLIDAEVCIRAELRQSVDIEDYVRRFPPFADQLRQLIQLDEKALPRSAPALVDVVDAPESLSDSMDFSVDIPSADPRPRVISGGRQPPLETPDWFIAEHCVASSPGRWLIRGRDADGGSALALKILELPAQLNSHPSQQLIDACRQAAEVTHPSWIAPRVAAIQQRHLGVVRPWIFARHWEIDLSVASDVAAAGAAAEDEQPAQLRRFASIAFALAAAHQAGAAHGGVHPENLFVDHENVVRVMDAGSSRRGLSRWLRGGQTTSGQDVLVSQQDRQRMDVQDLIKLVAGAVVGWKHEVAHQLVAEMRRIERHQQVDQACAMMGQQLMRWSDELGAGSSEPSPRTAPPEHSWRKLLARWFTGEQ